MKFKLKIGDGSTVLGLFLSTIIFRFYFLIVIVVPIGLTNGALNKATLLIALIDCTDDDRIWKDFGGMVLSDELAELYEAMDAAAADPDSA